MRIVDTRSLLAERREQGARQYLAPAEIFGRPLDVPIAVGANGEMATFDLPRGMTASALREVAAGAPANWQAGQPITAGEMLTTPANLAAFITKTVVDVAAGREDVPLLYTAVYARRIQDANMTQDVDVGAIQSKAHVVFLEHLEGDEIQFGKRTLQARQTVSLTTYAAGFEYTEDMIEYDATWQVTQLNLAFGRAYNALLNHIYLYPILSYAYAGTNQTPADATANTTFREKMRATLKAALIHAGQDTGTDSGIGRSPNILLAHSSRRWDIEEALQRFVANETEYPALAGIDTLVFYDGYSIKVGARNYVYPGVNTGKAYLIDNSTYLVELVRHDLRIDAGPGDLSRLVDRQIVGRTRRGLFAAPRECVEEITLP